MGFYFVHYKNLWGCDFSNVEVFRLVAVAIVTNGMYWCYVAAGTDQGLSSNLVFTIHYFEDCKCI